MQLLKLTFKQDSHGSHSRFTTDTANYQEAIDILKGRFGNSQLIMNSHMEALLNLQSVSGTPASLKSMRHFLDTVESHVRSLRTLGVPQSHMVASSHQL